MSSIALQFLSLALLHALLGVLCLVVAQGERKSKALWQWGWGLVTYAAGVVLILLPFMPYAFRQVVGNTLISLAALLTAQGLLANARYRLSWTIGLFGLAICSTLLLINHFLRFSLVVDISAPTIYASLLYLFAAIMLLRRPPADARVASRFLVATVCVTVAVWNARMITSAMAIGRSFDPSRADLSLSLFSVAQILLVVAASLGLLWVEVREMEADLVRAAVTDALTGLLNRRGILLRFNEEIERAQRQDQRFAIALFDVDRFKQINDAHGHLVGDAMLRGVAERFDKARRLEDVIGRIGGEEFIVILPHQDRTSAHQAAERLRTAVSDWSPGEGGPQATVSGGLAVYPDDGTDWDQLFQAADRRLYVAKRQGRDRIRSDEDSQT